MTFFPNAPFAAVYLLILVSGMAIASWCDLKTIRIPKWVTLSLAAAGLLANVVRGAWLAVCGWSGWAFDGSNAFAGGVDGLLFAVSGLAVGFVFFTLLWIFGTAGGGDVKLAAAVGAWMGPVYFFGVVALALPFVMILTVVRLGIVVIRGQVREGSLSAGKRRLHWRLLNYSVPMTLAIVSIIAFGFRTQLGL